MAGYSTQDLVGAISTERDRDRGRPLALEFPTLSRPPTDHHVAQFDPDELTNDCYYRCCHACFDLDRQSCFRRCCYFEELASNGYLPAFSALVGASNGCPNLLALYNSNNPTYVRRHQETYWIDRHFYQIHRVAYNSPSHSRH